MKKEIPFVVSKDNRTYANTKDGYLQNCFIETGENKRRIIKRPGFKNLKVVTTISTDTRGFMYCSAHSVFYLAIGDAVFSVTNDLATATEVIRKTPTSVTYSAAAGGTYTYVFAAAHGFTASQQVRVSGVTPAAYSGTKTIAAVTTTSVANDTFTVTGVGADPGAATLTDARVSPILTTTGRVYFDEMKDGSNVVVMLHIPKTSSVSSQLFKIASGGTTTKITDADYPTNCVGAGVSMDGYYFVFSENTSAGTRTINNCDLETPSTWNALSYTGADMYPDQGVTLVKFANHLLAMKQATIEFFYNAANATGSPFSKNLSSTLNIGCGSAESVQVYDNALIWMSRDQDSGLGVHMLTGSGLQKISTTFEDRILASTESLVNTGKVMSMLITYEGHKFYVLSIQAPQSSGTAVVGVAVVGQATVGVGVDTSYFRRTLVYDLTEGKWHEWKSNESDVQSCFFASHSVSGPNVSASANYTNTLVVHKDSGDIYEMSPPPIGSMNATTYKDGSSLIKCKIVTNRYDFGMQGNKKMGSLEIVGDKESSTCNFSMRYTDDDYQNWSTARTLDLSQRAITYRLGKFRRRAFELIHEADSTFRIEKLELDIEAI